MEEEEDMVAIKGTFKVAILEGEPMICEKFSVKLREKNPPCRCCETDDECGCTCSSRDDGQSAESCIGKIDLLPMRPDELPESWYFCNGDTFAVSTPQAKALLGLSDNFRADWGIVEEDGFVSLPNMFQDENGYFLRAVNGVTRQVGDKQEDAIRDFVSEFAGDNFNCNGVFKYIQKISSYAQGWDNPTGTDQYIGFDASRVVPTAEDNRPINVGMTPAIFLGA